MVRIQKTRPPALSVLRAGIRGSSGGQRVRALLAALVAVALWSVAMHPPPAGAQEFGIGCRLDDDDPLRAEIDRMMREGAVFEAQQRAALQEKVSRLGKARGWAKAEEDAYLRRAVFRGNDDAWEKTLAVAAAFVRVCEERADGGQRADAVRLFRQFYVVEEQQWQSIHEAVDADIAVAESGATR